MRPFDINNLDDRTRYTISPVPCGGKHSKPDTAIQRSGPGAELRNHYVGFRVYKSGIRMMAIGNTVLAAAVVYGTLALAPPAGAAVASKHLAVDCPQPYSQSCAPSAGLSITTAGPLYASFTADGTPPACAPGLASIWFNDEPVKGAKLEPGETVEAGKDMAPGTYYVNVHVEGVLGGCNTGAMSGWSGTLKVETEGDAVRDHPWLEPPYQPAPPK